jgi:hypothetical protein
MKDRWGGDMTWDKAYRGGTERYGESIYTKRWEMLGTYQLPLKEAVMFSWSLNDHAQKLGIWEYHLQCQAKDCIWTILAGTKK